MSNARRGTVKKDEASGTWYYVIDVSEPGEPRRQRRRRGFARKGDAEDELNRVARKVADGTLPTPSKVALGDFVDEYLAARHNLRATTIASYRHLFDQHVRPRIGARRIQAIRAPDLDHLYTELLLDGRRTARATRGAGLAPATVRQVHALLSGAFAWGVRHQRLGANPARLATPPRAESPETATWTVEQVAAFLAHPEVRGHDLAPLWRVAAATGLRRGELLGLAWTDVDLDAATIKVRHNVTEAAGQVSIGPPKTELSLRWVKINAATVTTLTAHRDAQDAHRALMGAGWHDHDLVFPAVDGRPRRPVDLSRAWSALVARTGLPRVTLHALRHAHGTTLLENGVPVHVVARRLGHDPAMLLRTYAHVLDGAQDAAAGLEALLDGGRPPLRAVEGSAEVPVTNPVTTEPVADAQ